MCIAALLTFASKVLRSAHVPPMEIFALAKHINFIISFVLFNIAIGYHIADCCQRLNAVWKQRRRWRWRWRHFIPYPTIIQNNHEREYRCCSPFLFFLHFNLQSIWRTVGRIRFDAIRYYTIFLCINIQFIWLLLEYGKPMTIVAECIPNHFLIKGNPNVVWVWVCYVTALFYTPSLSL